MSASHPQNSSSFPDASSKTGPLTLTISDLLLIQRQTELIQEISHRVAHPKRLSTEVTDLSFQIPSTSHHFNMSMSCLSLKRQFSLAALDDPELELALQEVMMKCSKKTYNTIRDNLTGRKERRQERLLEKQKRHNEELTKKIAKLNEKLIELDLKFKSYKSGQDLEGAFKKRASLNDTNQLNKQADFIKWEKSLIYQEKTLSAAHKKINKQLDLIEQEKQQNENLKRSIQEILQKISIEAAGDNVKWQGDILEKCRLNINTRKRLLSSQEQTIEGHYFEVKELVNKIKQLALK